ncbi:MAG: 3-oxoacyl-ACP synthase [Thermoplasmata archaeon]
MNRIGIASYGIYIPEKVVTAKDISKEFNIPENIVIEKQGLKEKHISKENEMPSEMALRAAEIAIENAEKSGIEKNDIGAILYIGSQWKDYNVWLISTYLQEMLGLHKAYSLDISAMCAGMVSGLYIAKSILNSDTSIKSILLVGASKESYIVNPNDPKTTWMDDFADAGVAAIVSNNLDKNLILNSDFLTDGSLWAGTLLVTGGAKLPFDEKYCYNKRPYLESLLSKEEFKQKMESVSLKNFKNVILNAIKKSGLKKEDVKMVFLNHMKPSFHYELLKSIGLSDENSIYLNNYGHSQSADQFIGLDIAIKNKIFEKGNIVFAAAGTGYVWSATVIRWG